MSEHLAGVGVQQLDPGLQDFPGSGLPGDMRDMILRQIDQILVDDMTLKELCMKLMEIFDLTMKTACNYTRWLIQILPVYLLDRKHIRLIAT